MGPVLEIIFYCRDGDTVKSPVVRCTACKQQNDGDGVKDRVGARCAGKHKVQVHKRACN